MARPLRIEYEGAVYHVTMRGNQQRAIFRCNQDRDRFLFKLAESLERYEVSLYLFCLMTNHVHLLLETPRGNLSRFMHRLQTAYTVYFNRRHQQSGHLMQGRFSASLVNEDEYILKLSRYVHLNPIFVGEHKDKSQKERVEVLRNYAWSSYRSYVGKVKPLDYVDYGPVLSMMGGLERKQASAYRRFVEGGIVDIDAAFIEGKNRSKLCLGSDAFHDEIGAMYRDLVEGRDHKEDVSFRHENKQVSVENVLECVCEILKISPATLRERQRDSLVRPIASKALCDHAGLTQREVAEVLGLNSGGAVSKQLAMLAAKHTKDKSLQETLKDLSKLIQERC